MAQVCILLFGEEVEVEKGEKIYKNEKDEEETSIMSILICRLHDIGALKFSNRTECVLEHARTPHTAHGAHRHTWG